MSNSTSPDFVMMRDEDEYLHPVGPDAHYTALETNLYGFNCASEGIDGLLYLWMHPALKMSTMMICVWKGWKKQQLAADYFNQHDYLPMPADLADYSLQLGTCTWHAKVVKPLKEIAIDISDPRRAFEVRLVTRAVIPPVGRAGGGHFTQLMENEGEMLLNGKTYDLAGFYMRDRSFSQNRGEQPQSGPPMNWMTACFDRDFAFHIAILDTSIFPAPEYGPEWHRHIDSTKTVMKWESGGRSVDLNLRYGWWYMGEFPPRRLTRATWKTTMASDGLVPLAIDLEITDSAGETHSVHGEVVSFTPKNNCNNIMTYCAFNRWTYRGRVGYGEMQIVYDNEHLTRFGEQSSDVPPR